MAAALAPLLEHLTLRGIRLETSDGKIVCLSLSHTTILA